MLAGIFLEKKQTSVFMTGGSGVSRIKIPLKLGLSPLTATGGQRKNYPLNRDGSQVLEETALGGIFTFKGTKKRFIITRVLK